jgi:sugar lactone lactonase YvrE
MQIYAGGLTRVLVGTILCLCTIVFQTRNAFADSPPRPQSKFPSPNGAFFAQVELGRRVVVYRRANGRANEIWRATGPFFRVFVADNPDYLVSVYRGGNLLSISHKPDEEMVTLYRRGRMLRRVRLNELVERPDGLRRTVSHLVWAESMGLVGADRFRVQTAEGKEVIFDLPTGKTISVGPIPADSRLKILD